MLPPVEPALLITLGALGGAAAFAHLASPKWAAFAGGVVLHMYALVVDTVGGSDELFIYVIDPRTNDLVVKIPLRDRLPADVYTLMRNASLRLVSPSTLEVWMPRYYTQPGQYLYILYEGPWGSYVAALDPKDFSLVKNVKIYDKYTRQYGGISPDGKLLVVAQRQAQQIVYLDAKTLDVIRAVKTDANPCDVAPSPDGNYFAIPVRADGAEGKPEYVLIIDREGREVARAYFRRPGEAGPPTEPSMNCEPSLSRSYGKRPCRGATWLRCGSPGRTPTSVADTPRCSCRTLP